MSGESLCWAGLIVLRELTSAATEQPFIPVALFAVPVESVSAPSRMVVNDEASSRFLNNGNRLSLITLLTVAYCTLRVA